MELDGQVVKKPFAIGTKSEHEAIYLETAEGNFVLRRPDANPFEMDGDLESLVGKRVRCSGFASRGTFFVSHYTVLSQAEA
jgi:hypothetical protein